MILFCKLIEQIFLKINKQSVKSDKIGKFRTRSELQLDKLPFLFYLRIQVHIEIILFCYI